ncbi:hypothetical protein CNMCM5793_003759 [Aspergillus hiratsukae]|uniref:DUF6590 domain-containing protein n=1 Tax=Aspergillus hiratsukae TaxID=1194566 RepID=A0A8H6PEB2_9EURO|nr:hypothetical protein CNMCM5793_003759 [Aspergillus hiratsukae]KAF7172707.1 hypothetical protein CNMCM6106_006851 [Aspergillus hiratsukae]
MTFWDHLTEDEKRSSVDRTCSREFRDGSAWEAAGRVKEKWDEDVYPNLKAFLNEKQRDLNPTSRKMAIYNIVCWMVGKEWHLSHPATVFVCGTKKVAKRALRQIECFLKLGNSGFRVYTHIATIALNGGTSGQDPSGKIGLCGTLVNVGNFREAFERQTTVGGVVHINGYYYCMTAAHPFLGVDEDGDDGDDDSDVANESFGEDSEVGNNNTVENRDLTADHIYRDGLHSFLGAIPYNDDASNRKSFLSERFDWALLKISDECEPGLNKIDVPSGILIPWKISPTSPKTPLWAATGTHQAVEIQSTPTLSGICLDKSGIVDVWSLNMMSYPGDSGSWVVDPHDDSIVAIVIARCEALNVTYALPARDVFNDIARSVGETIDLTVADKESLLTLAAKQGKADLVKELLSAIDLDSKDERGRTAMYDNVLRAASAEGHDKIVRLLLEDGADPNAQSGSALLAASKEGHDKIVKLLLNQGADPNPQSGSALLAASKEGHDKIVWLLLFNGADPNPQSGSALLAASKEGHDKIVQLLLNQGADPNAQSGSALLAASKEGHNKIVQLLLDNGADINAQGRSALLERPAHLAPARNPEAHRSASRRHAIYTPTPMSGVGSDHAWTHSTSEQSRPLKALQNQKAYSIRGESDLGVYRPLLGQRYEVQRSPSEFFVVGRVFEILWHGGGGQQKTPDMSQFTRGGFSEEIFSGTKRMVVVRPGSQCAWCIPITTYDGKRVAKAGVNPENHAIIYMRGSVPTQKANEPQMTKEPLEVEPASPDERLDEMSRLNFSKVYNVEYDVKVHPVGMISWTSMAKFTSYLNNEFSDGPGQAGRQARAREKGDEWAGAGTYQSDQSGQSGQSGRGGWAGSD